MQASRCSQDTCCCERRDNSRCPMSLLVLQVGHRLLCRNRSAVFSIDPGFTFLWSSAPSRCLLEHVPLHDTVGHDCREKPCDFLSLPICSGYSTAVLQVNKVLVLAKG